MGANTVKGPSPESVSTRPASLTAVTSVEKSSLLEATSTIVPGGSSWAAALEANPSTRAIADTAATTAVFFMVPTSRFGGAPKVAAPS